jgi:tetratricopeptide (TPR) repeat protein
VKLLLKIAELNENRSNFFNAGKALDNASACCRESNDLEGVLAYADQAANLFLQGAVPDTAFNTLTRAAKHVESTNTDAAIQFYKKAANLYKMEGGRIREAADVLARVCF